MSEFQTPSQLRKAVKERANSCCEYCWYQERLARGPFVLEHTMPKSRGGETTFDSLAWSCHACNGHKYNKTQGIDPETGESVPLYNPRQQQWNEHFKWSEDYTRIEGKTSTGRATVEALRLNDEGVVNYRRILYTAGEHPPKENLVEG